MYKNILVPLDGSPRAEAILPHIENLAKAHGAGVVLMHVFEPSHDLIDAINRKNAETVHQEMDNCMTYLAEQQAAFSTQDIKSDTVLTYGPIVDEIIKTAKRENADLIAMVSHGRTGLPRVFQGSIAAEVLEHIDRPVLLIRSLDH